MFNPCHPFTTELLEAMLRKEVLYFVKSTFDRGINWKDDKQKGAYLISHYHELSEAERHFNLISHDPHSFLYDLRKTEHLEKLRKETVQAGDYKLYSRIMIPEIEKKITTLFKDNTKRYLYKNTNWDLKGSVRITPFLYFQLGELYVRISHRGDEIKIKFEELENS